MAFEVRAHWDSEAGVWWAESDDIVGLVAEASTLEALVDDMRQTIPELMRMNSQDVGSTLEVHLVADRIEELTIA